MSRIGRKPITLPDGVTVTVAGTELTIKGPKGTLTVSSSPLVNVAVEGNVATVTATDPNDRRVRARWGLTRALLANAVTGVSTGFERKLEINGVGFKASVSAKKLVLAVGFSHLVEYPVPDGVTVTVEKNVITVAGIDRQLVGETAAQIRGIKKPEPYKGKGIKYVDEVIRRKAGKMMKAAEGGK